MGPTMHDPWWTCLPGSPRGIIHDPWDWSLIRCPTGPYNLYLLCEKKNPKTSLMPLSVWRMRMVGQMRPNPHESIIIEVVLGPLFDRRIIEVIQLIYIYIYFWGPSWGRRLTLVLLLIIESWSPVFTKQGNTVWTNENSPAGLQKKEIEK